MSGIDRIGGGKVPTGPLPGANGAPQGTPSASPSDTGARNSGDKVSTRAAGHESSLEAADDLPSGEVAVPADLAALLAKGSREGQATLMANGSPVSGAALKRLSGDALAKLQVRITLGASSVTVRPSDIGLIGISVGSR